jgi:hypothetical protein
MNKQIMVINMIAVTEIGQNLVMIRAVHTDYEDFDLMVAEGGNVTILLYYGDYKLSADDRITLNTIVENITFTEEDEEEYESLYCKVQKTIDTFMSDRGLAVVDICPLNNARVYYSYH